MSISREEALNQLAAMAINPQDPEEAHGHADDILLSRLRALGESDVADAYEAAARYVPFWYA